MPRKRTLVLVIATAVAAALFVAQLVSLTTEPAQGVATLEPAWDSPRTRELVVRACFDCHSAETRWPWYASVAPFSFLVRDHVEEGRLAVDFSRWDVPYEEAGESAEVVRDRFMPPRYYMLVHPEARLTDAEREELAAGLEATIGTSEGEEEGGEEGEEEEEEEDGERLSLFR